MLYDFTLIYYTLIIIINEVSRYVSPSTNSRDQLRSIQVQRMGLFYCQFSLLFSLRCPVHAYVLQVERYPYRGKNKENYGRVFGRFSFENCYLASVNSKSALNT